MTRFRYISRIVARLLAGLGLFLLLISVAPQPLDWWIQALAGPWNDPKGDTLIVLGADMQQDGTLGLSSYWRAVYASRVWREGGFTRILVSGAGSSPVPVSVAMQEFLVCRGTPEASIQVEEQSNSTRENALATAQLLGGGGGRKVLLTSDYHMYRAYRVFRKAGLDVAPRPFPDAGKRSHDWRDRWRVFWDLTLESSKIGYYRIRGWI